MGKIAKSAAYQILIFPTVGKLESLITPGNSSNFSSEQSAMNFISMQQPAIRFCSNFAFSYWFCFLCNEKYRKCVESLAVIFYRLECLKVHDGIKITDLI